MEFKYFVVSIKIVVDQKCYNISNSDATLCKNFIFMDFFFKHFSEIDSLHESLFIYVLFLSFKFQTLKERSEFDL